MINYNRVKSSILFSILLILLSTPYVKASSLMWTQTYGGINQEICKGIIQTSDGGYALAGHTNSFGVGRNDFWLVKTDAQGTMKWNQSYGGIEDEYCEALVETSDGGFALVGRTYSFGDLGSSTSWFVKTDGSGNMQWNKTIGGDDFFALVETKDGGFAMAGISSSWESNDAKIGLVKTDGSGNIQWNQTCPGYLASSIIETSDGGLALAGSTYTGLDNVDYGLIKTDASGNIQWNQTYEGGKFELPTALVETSDGGFAIIGTTETYDGDESDAEVWLVKTDGAGNMQWNQTYGGMRMVGGLVITSDGGFFLAGPSKQIDHFLGGPLLVKTDGSGNIQWTQNYEGIYEDYSFCSGLIVTSDGGFALTGHTYEYDVWLMKTDEFGIVPEFPSWIILPLFLVATMSVIMFKKKLFNQSSKDL